MMLRFLNTRRASDKTVVGTCACTAPQEILLILEEYWNRNPQLQAVPIYQASGLAAKAMTIYQTYIEMMNDDIRKAFQVFPGFACRAAVWSCWQDETCLCLCWAKFRSSGLLANGHYLTKVACWSEQTQ